MKWRILWCQQEKRNTTLPLYLSRRKFTLFPPDHYLRASQTTLLTFRETIPLIGKYWTEISQDGNSHFYTQLEAAYTVQKNRPS